VRAPPPLRPKPADGVSWKPKPPSRLRTPLLSLGAGASNAGEAGVVESGIEMSVSDVGRVMDAGVWARADAARCTLRGQKCVKPAIRGGGGFINIVVRLIIFPLFVTLSTYPLL
jgi:hypothetical protein